ncbi:putative Arf GTPase activating protein [Medicago truncatula]|uniref:Putative Arf GTPase activating protein n=1 Tax=Medicago truncatula TaxID=3880 RepID=A0A396HHP6_MEDTR|nr:probable ADP-ribosylation factor GTPase-activating protein AGD14 [Medicago truncatula]XP_039683101.1 probable ADP-ribosylation factor GTPase-activating protein AGD14 [Medicago truncatula]RHN52860.1 putative Arf GTPase activating protein [Medicago truncatula]
MGTRFKEDERNERAIRTLLKLEPNRRCINCNSLGPQYVCTNFWTFVCTNCSGIHREFTHRVKSVSMAKFTSQEVTALQEGGNQRAKEIYFKEWDAQRNSFPDSSNVNRLREFIKHVYEDRRFTGDRTSDKPPRGKAGDKDDSYENRRVEAYQGGSKSPPYEDTQERRYGDRSSPGGRSPGYDQESRQYGDYKRSPGRPPVVNDWRREDRRVSDGDYKVESQSPERARDLGSSSPPVVRPVRDILGENVVPLRISGPPKPNSGRAADASSLTQRTASSGSLVSSNESQVDIKLETAKSLIDFDADPEPVAPTVHAQQSSVPQPVLQSGNSSDDNWASFDVASEAKANPSTSNLNPLESALSQLSVPESLPSHASGVQGHVPTAAPSFGSFSAFTPSGASVPSVPPHNNVGQWASVQHQQPTFPAAASQQFPPSVGGAVNSQPSHVPSVPTGQGHPNTPMPHAYHHASKPANEAFNSGRTELPEDLFTVKHQYFPAPVQGWQMGPPQGIPMQYNNVAPVSSFSQPSRSTNPFDVSSKQTPDQAPSFPSMSSLHGALPNVPPSIPMHPPSQSNPLHAWNPPLPNVGTVQSSTLGYPPHAWTPSLPSFQGSLPNVPPSGITHPSNLGYPSHAWTPTPSSSLGPGSYMGQQMATNIPMPRQGVGNFGTEGNMFGLSNPNQQLPDRPSRTPNSNPLPKGGNPFG